MRLGVVPLLLALVASSAGADVLILKGGQRLEGEVADKGKSYDVRVGDGVLSVAKAEVLRHMPSVDAIHVNAEKLNAQARALYDEATKPDVDPKSANEKLKQGVDLLRKAAELYQEAREVYVDDAYASLDKSMVKLFQEMRLYRDKMSSEIAKPAAPPPAEPPAAPKPEAAKPAEPAPEPAPPSAPPAPAKPDAAQLRALAKAGDVEAMYAVGLQLELEDWSAAESAKWLRAAAEKGQLRAQAHLGLLALEGRGRKPDAKEAQAWLLKADARGEPLAKVYLARMHFDGLGGARSLRRADDLCERAATALLPRAMAGDPRSLSALGWMHLEGLGTQQNSERALLLLRNAASKGDVRALMMMGRMFDKGHGVEANRDEALKAYRTAAEKGFAPAQAAFAEMHDSNAWRKNNPFEDRKLAREWFLKAANQGHPLGQFWMGWFHIRGHEGAKDEKEGHRLWGEAMKTATGEVRLMLLNDFGWCHERGVGLPKDMKLAERYWREAAELGHPMSQFNMGFISERELKNPREAFRWFDMAARSGYANACAKIGDLHRAGAVVPKNLLEAERWYAVAVQKGVETASEKLRAVQDERKAAKR